eukprot:6623847-Alexandrium_andersonii.AAC.1
MVHGGRSAPAQLQGTQISASLRPAERAGTRRIAMFEMPRGLTRDAHRRLWPAAPGRGQRPPGRPRRGAGPR